MVSAILYCNVLYSTKPHRISVRSVTINRRTSRDAACTMIIGKDAPLGPSCVKVGHRCSHIYIQGQQFIYNFCIAAAAWLGNNSVVGWYLVKQTLQTARLKLMEGLHETVMGTKHKNL